ncbi:ATP synthase subunit 4 mitochondrial precursor [Lindgomyces ingoldianus]|uniref:ATP synthase subunit 4 mitochondrial n=1 Tax=Lindgomyces ingoldianus TaxID=673940 RepID=A0ACB6QMK5_9PLEO|nr:ATP synthase subunit 4 mitochondrial precursor [Lindgomyces ingoldianus]KAF2468136.1 ATP synthase subunit 4 mitochondrial precursor [Lindgomyces ingoldianus]
MASRLARSAVGAARLRPTLPFRTLPAITAQIAPARYNSNVPAEDPKKKAQSILDSIPGNSFVSKAAVLSAGAGISVAAISNEIYVVNEESIVAISLLTIFWAVAHYAGPAWSDYAQTQVDKIKGILNAARADHTAAVKQRIESVQDLGGVIDITKTLFEVSKETAQLEAQAYELEQKTSIAHEAKAVLDSWVRYEGQVKQRQQRELAESIIAKIEKELENPRVLKQILDQSVADVERIVSQKA